MAKTLSAEWQTSLKGWLLNQQANPSALLGKGYQGEVYLYRHDSQAYVIKAPAMHPLYLRKFYRRMLRHEYRAYQRLEGISGIPKCYGLIDDQYLVLEYIEGKIFREVFPDDTNRFFTRFLENIQAMHARGIAHGDIKKKGNLMVSTTGEPCLIDFGAAVIRKSGFAPINHFLYRLARQFDFNAWIKLKYDGQYGRISEQDLRYYRRTWIEKAARRLKRFYKVLLRFAKIQ